MEPGRVGEEDDRRDHDLAEQPTTRNTVARTMPQNPSSGRPTADAKSSTFQAIQKISGPSRIVATSTASATKSPPATRAPIPRMRSTMRRAGLTRRVYVSSCRSMSKLIVEMSAVKLTVVRDELEAEALCGLLRTNGIAC